MKLSRRKFLHAAAGTAAAPAVARLASAADYPTRPVHLIIGYPPGGSADMTARLTGQWLSERLGQQFIVESRPGAATNIATESVVFETTLMKRCNCVPAPFAKTRAGNLTIFTTR